MSATLVTGPFLIFHYFLLLMFPLQKPLTDFSVLGGSKGLTFNLSFSKASRYHIFRPTFWLLFFLSFFLNGWIPFHQTERSPATFLHGPSFWLIGHICSHSLCSWACFLELSQSQSGLAAYPEDPRLLGIPRYPSSVFSLGSPSDFLP